jgi:hypothetical protein
MKPKISAGSLFKNHWLKVRPDGVFFYESTIGFGVRKFRFDQIDCVLLSPADELSFQVGNEVFTIPMKPTKAAHQYALAMFVDGVRSCGAGVPAAAP